MQIRITLLIVSFIYTMLTSIVYFSKNRINNSENAVYEKLLSITPIGLLLEIGCNVTAIYKMNDSSKGTYNAVNRRIAKEIGNIRYVFNLFSTDFDDASFKAATELIDDSDKYCERLYKDPFKKLDDESLWR